MRRTARTFRDRAVRTGGEQPRSGCRRKANGLCWFRSALFTDRRVVVHNAWLAFAWSLPETVEQLRGCPLGCSPCHAVPATGCAETNQVVVVNNWRSDYWDPDRWQLPAVLRRGHAWIRATRRRRWTVGVLLTVFVLVVFPGLLGATASATAESGTRSAGSSVGSALGWTHVTDSSGVEGASYIFATDHGGVFNPGDTAISLVIGLEFAGWKIIVITAIWLIGYALSFEWLNLFSKALLGVAHSLTGQIATPIMLVTAATIGAFFVAWFVVRGLYSKATVQVVTMVTVGLLGPIFLAEPLADVLSSDGLLAKGRDLGIAVAAGLNGDTNIDPSHMVATMQGTLTDNFARRPLQVWNFGHVVDEQPSCRAAWSAGVAARSEDRVKRGIGACGDGAAKESMENPNFEQIGTGLLLLLAGAILLAFGAVLAIKVIRAALDTIYHGLMSIFGFAAGGFVYGPTQTFLIRNVVDGFVAAARMTAYTIFLGLYVLILGDLFKLAGDQVMVVFIIGAIFEIVAILQLKRLSNGLDRGNEWIANRFALAVQGSGGGARGSGGRGTALGMAGGSGAKAAPGMGLVSGLGALNTVNTSPMTAWLAGGTVNPLNPLARARRKVERTNARISATRAEGYAETELVRANWRHLARTHANRDGAGMHTELGVARAVQALRDRQVSVSRIPAVLLAEGANEDFLNNALYAMSVQEKTTSQNPYGFAPVQKAVAAARAVENYAGRGADEAFAVQAFLAADSFVRNTVAPTPGAAIDNNFVQAVQRDWDHERRLRANVPAAAWDAAGRNTRWAIGREAAIQHRDAALAYREGLNGPNSDVLRAALMRSARRISNLDHLQPELGSDAFT
ncbi:hypothetical protein [Nocardia sp. NPDC049707]|uniref:hypothetical protein n=1 Tax=Nocardia sp. NPDC049707 TaxID=3154735 RepID=UPI003436D7EC